LFLIELHRLDISDIFLESNYKEREREEGRERGETEEKRSKRKIETHVSELEKRPQPQLPRSSEELEDLHRLLHFPEEVALRLTESEYQLFYQVPPHEYLRHVAQDQITLQKPPARPPPSPSRSCSNPSTTSSSTQTEDESSWPVATVYSTVQTLIDRFNEVHRRPFWGDPLVLFDPTLDTAVYSSTSTRAQYLR
jgi:hypothetical protein